MPSQHPSRHSPTDPFFLGFAGHAGSGKTSAAKYVSSHYGFQYTRYSHVLRDWRHADASDREQLQTLGWDIMSGGLQAELNARLLAGLDRSRNAAIDGLRHPIDFESLTSAFGASFSLIFVDASELVRYERLRSRFSTYDAFLKAQAHPVESNIDNLRPLAAVTLSSDASLEDVYQRLDECLETWGVVGDHL